MVLIEVKLTDGEKVFINPEQIVLVRATPDGVRLNMTGEIHLSVSYPSVAAFLDYLQTTALPFLRTF